MEDIREFMKERTRNAVRRGPNCIGSALYISGEISSESYYSREKAKLKLSRLKNFPKPDLGYIALWQSQGEPFHAGVIFEDNPFQIVHRNESNGLLTQLPLEDFVEHLYKFTGLKPIYKIPNKLK
jgi:hypothetical protein